MCRWFSRTLTQGSNERGELQSENRVVAIVTIPILQVEQLAAGLQNMLAAHRANAEAFKKKAEESLAAQKK
jgi:hypothetical protein